MIARGNVQSRRFAAGSSPDDPIREIRPLVRNPDEEIESQFVHAPFPRSAVGNWNQVLGEILPSLQTVSAILQPFVQIKFLRED